MSIIEFPVAWANDDYANPVAIFAIFDIETLHLLSETISFLEERAKTRNMKYPYIELSANIDGGIWMDDWGHVVTYHGPKKPKAWQKLIRKHLGHCCAVISTDHRFIFRAEDEDGRQECESDGFTIEEIAKILGANVQS